MKPIIISLIILLSATTIYAEAVFLKNGKIIEGKIIEENEKSLIIKNDDETIKINRNTIKRILFSNDYKEKVSIKTDDDFVLDCYIVDENDEFYIVRQSLNSKNEDLIPKKTVKKILNYNQTSGKVSVNIAAVSCIPFYSGSWNAEFNSKGLFFVILKSAAFSYSCYNWYKFKDSHEKIETHYDIKAVLGLLAYITAVKYDISFSQEYIKNYNKAKYGYNENDYNFYITPENNLFTNNNYNEFSKGFNIGVTYYFN